MQRMLIILVFLTFSLTASAQYSGPRLFWDLPHFYATAPDVMNIENQVGLGLGTAINVATFWGTSRLGAGTTFTLDPQSKDIPSSFLLTPYTLLEGGLGIYRFNANQCNQTNQSAFTALGMLGLRYDFDTRSDVPPGAEGNFGLNYYVGAELGYFFLRDMYRNIEVVLRGNYFPKSQVISATFGFKFFLNIREMGRY